MLSAVSGLTKRIRDSAAAFAEVFRNPNLRWNELAWIASSLAHYGFLITVSVYAYEAGGNKTVGLLLLARLVPAALVSPFAGLLGDRYPRQRVMFITNLVRATLVSAITVTVYAGAAHGTVYALAIAATIATTPYHSAEAALTPTIANTPSELTAANAVTNGVDSLAFFVGPALAGLLLSVVSTGAVFGVMAAILAVSLVFIGLIHVEGGEAIGAGNRVKDEHASSTIVSEALAGTKKTRVRRWLDLASLAKGSRK